MIYHLKTVINVEFNSVFCNIISLNLVQVNDKMELTSAKLVTHFSSSESTKWQEQKIVHQPLAIRPYY